MANKISGKYIEDDAIDGRRLLLKNGQAARAQDAAGQPVALYTLDAAGDFRLLEQPLLPRLPERPEEAANKRYIDQSLEARGAYRWYRESRVLTQTDISRGYVDLTYQADPYSIDCGTTYLVLMYGRNYTAAYQGEVTRVYFVGDSAPTGSAPLLLGDEIWFKYQY